MMPNSIIIVATGSDVCDMSPVLVVGVCLLRWFLKAEPNSNTALSLHTLKQLEQLSAVTMVMVASFLFTLGATRKSCVSTSHSKSSAPESEAATAKTSATPTSICCRDWRNPPIVCSEENPTWWRLRREGK